MQQAVEDSGSKGAVVVEGGYGDAPVHGGVWGMGTPLFSCVSTEKLAAVDEAALSGRW